MPRAFLAFYVKVNDLQLIKARMLGIFLHAATLSAFYTGSKLLLQRQCLVSKLRSLS